MISDDDLKAYCNQYVYRDSPVMPATRVNLGVALGMAERECVLLESVNRDHPRLFTTQLTDEDDPLRGVSVIRVARYDVRKREAPKRPNLIRRLLGMLR